MKRRSPHLHRPFGGKSRSGAACVEAAFALPILFTLTFGTMDVCSSIFLKESVTIAAYEGARVGVARGGTNQMVRQRIFQFLDERGIDYEPATAVTISSPSFESADTLEHVTVTVTVRGANNLLVPAPFFADMSFSASVTMRKEFENVGN